MVRHVAGTVVVGETRKVRDIRTECVNAAGNDGAPVTDVCDEAAEKEGTVDVNEKLGVNNVIGEGEAG